jgi:P-loop Nucleotide Kinase3
MRELTRGAVRVEKLDYKLVPYDELWVDDGVAGVEIGRRRADFPGTDTLAMNAMPRVAEWLATKLSDVVCAEGDRLTHIRFFDAAAAVGFRVNLFVLGGRMSVLDARCTARGSDQNRSWRMSRGTMCANVAARAEQAGYRVFHLDAEAETGELAELVREQVPIMRRLQEREEAGSWQ